MTRIVLDLRIQQQQRPTKSKTMPSSNLYSITGFFILSTTEDFVLNNFMCCEIILYIIGFFSNRPDLCPLDASNPTLWWPKVSLDFARCPAVGWAKEKIWRSRSPCLRLPDLLGNKQISYKQVLDDWARRVRIWALDLDFQGFWSQLWLLPKCDLGHLLYKMRVIMAMAPIIGVRSECPCHPLEYFFNQKNKAMVWQKSTFFFRTE